MRKGGAHLRTCSCAPLLTSTKSMANEFLTTYRISAQSVQPFLRCRKGVHLNVRTCRCTPPTNCVICTAAWSLDTHQIWSLCAEPFLIYSLAANFDTLHSARANYEGYLPNEPNTVVRNFNNSYHHSVKTACKSDA